MLLLHQAVAMPCSSAWLEGRPGISSLDTYSLLLYSYFMDGWMDALAFYFLKGAFIQDILGGNHLFTILAYILFPPQNRQCHQV